MSSNYWSSTTNADNTNNAWHVNFNNGNVNNNNKSNSYYVRAVRGGKCLLLSFESVYRAYLYCRKRKRGTINALRFEYDLLDNLINLALDLQKCTYRPSSSVCFITTMPKLREIFAADFRDRVVHHLVVRELEKIYEPKFIHDSYASRQGKGTHAAVKQLQRFMRKATKNQKRPAYFLQLDIRSFFMSIDKNILFRILEEKLLRRKIQESNALLYLLHCIIYHDCVKDHVFKGDPVMLDKIPAHKSLFKTPWDKGLPIGNLTSQFFSNVYLNELDQFAKHVLKCRFYVRYVDDFILISPRREKLAEWRNHIEAFLEKRLALRLKEKSKIKKVSDGSDFLGYIIRPSYILSRKRVVNNLKYKLALFQDGFIQRFQAHGMNIRKIIMLPEMVIELRQTLSSYLGHFKHADTFKLVNSIFEKNPWLMEYFVLHEGKLMDRFRYKGRFRSLRAQCLFFRSRLRETILLFRIGRFLEVYDTDAVLIYKSFGLKKWENYRGMKVAAGFPEWLEKKFVHKFFSLRKDLAIVDEGMAGKFVKDRYVKEIYRISPLAG